MLATLRSLRLGSPERLRLYRGVASIFLLRFFQLGTALVSTYFLARSMSKDAFGQYNMVMNAVGIASLFSLSGLTNSLVQAVARGFEGTFRAIVPIAFFSSFVGSVGLASLSGWYFVKGNEQNAWGLMAAAVLLPFAHGLVQWKSVIIGRERFDQLMLADGAVSLLTYSLVIAAVVLFPGEYVLAILVTLIVPAVFNLCLTAFKYRQISVNAAVEEQNIRYGIRTTFYSGLGSIGSNLDRILVFSFLSPVALAVYVAAAKIPELLSGAMQDVGAVLAPRLAKHEAYSKRIDKIFSIMAFGYGFIVIAAAFLLVPIIVPFLYGSNYADSVPYAQALTCSVAIGFHADLRFRFVRSQIDVRGYRDTMLISSAVRFLAFFTLVPLFGIIGAVVGMFIYRISLIVIVRIVILRHLKK
jgi:O-antigen/teichoic acid export membrane protein